MRGATTSRPHEGKELEEVEAPLVDKGFWAALLAEAEGLDASDSVALRCGLTSGSDGTLDP